MTRHLHRAVLLFSSVVVASAPAPSAAAGPSASAQAEEGFQITGAFRAQIEAIDGQFRAGRAEEDVLLSFRTNVVASWRHGPVTFLGELSDARGYGQARNSSVSSTEINALEPLQAFVAIDLGGSVAKAGRFTMEVGSTRLIARPDSSNSPPAFTGVLVTAVPQDDQALVAFWTMPNLRLPGDADGLRRNEVQLDRSTSDLQFFGVSYGGPLTGHALGEAYAYRLVEQDAPNYETRNRAFWTVGARLHQPPREGALDFDFEAAVQSGRARASTSAADTRDRDVSASFAHAEVGRRFNAGWKPRASVHFDFGSGDDAGSTSRIERFDPLFGARRGDFGPTSLYGPLTRANLVSVGAKVEIKPSSRLDAFAMYRASWLHEATDTFAATGRRDQYGLSGSFEGHQLETRLRRWLVPDRLRLEAGGAFLWHGDFLINAPGRVTSRSVTRYIYGSIGAHF